MNKIPKYLNFKEKEKHFNLRIIENIEDFHRLAESFKTKSGIFRGVSSSSYKIFTSLQREIIKNDLKEEFTENYINTFKNCEILKKYFGTINVNLSRFSIYSFLQHYGQPTPFLDFTKNFEIALYFAIEGFDYSRFTQSQSINDYFSIFFIEQDDLELLSIQEIVEEIQTTKGMFWDLLSDQQKEKYRETHFETFELILGLSIFDVHFIEQTNLADFLDINNNIRIIAQEGVFICYNNKDCIPLEIGLKRFLDGHTTFRPSAIDDDEIEGEEVIEREYNRAEKYEKFQKRLDCNIIKSFEIKKTLIPEIQKEHFLQREIIYPDPIEICKKIFEQAKNK